MECRILQDSVTALFCQLRKYIIWFHVNSFYNEVEKNLKGQDTNNMLNHYKASKHIESSRHAS